MTQADSQVSRGIFSGHPAGLRVLISLKVWELFSYQGMRAFLVFYLIDAFAMDDADATLLFGSYTALVLATSVLGGYCADRWLGPREAMMGGAVLIMAGHCSLAAENMLVGIGMKDGAFQLFCTGLGLIAVGTGFLKPNVLTMIGRLYRRDDSRREAGYYVYYIGVNVGSFLAPIVCGGIADRFGWTWGFAAAAVGMALGLILFIIGRRHVTPFEAGEENRAAVPRVMIYTGVFVAVVIATLLVQHGFALGILLSLTMIVGLFMLLRRAYRSGKKQDLPMVLKFLALLPIPLLFSVLFEQLATSINLFSDRAVDRDFVGFMVSAPQLLSLNSLFVLVMLPMLAIIWDKLEAVGRNPAPFSKFAIGFSCFAAGFLVLVIATQIGALDTRISMRWVVGAYILLTIGELCIAPLALSLVGRMISDSYAGLAMGLVLLSFSIGNFLSSILAGTVSLPKEASIAVTRATYGEFFLIPLTLSLGIAAFCKLADRWLSRQPVHATAISSSERIAT